MKNKLYILGLLALFVTVIGGVSKIMHWPGASILLTIGYLSLGLLFFPLAVWSSYKGGGGKNKFLYVSALLTLVVNFIGALFKIMHWPGAGWFLIFGISFPVIVFLPVYLYYHTKEKPKSLVNFMYILFLLIYLGVMSALLAVSSQSKISKDVARIHQMIQVDEFSEQTENPR